MAFVPSTWRDEDDPEGPPADPVAEATPIDNAHLRAEFQRVGDYADGAAQAAADAALDEAKDYADGPLTITPKTAHYAPALADHSTEIEMAAASGNLNVTLNAGVFSPGHWVNVVRAGAATVTFVAGAGVTLDSPGGDVQIGATWASVRAICRPGNHFRLEGYLA